MGEPRPVGFEPTRWAEVKYFTSAEMACKHCGIERMVHGFMARLDELRERYGAPLRVTSGYRCPEYNDTISTTGIAGPHTTGQAVDLHCAGGANSYRLLSLATTLGFEGIGVRIKGKNDQRFVHLDMRGFRVWSY